MGTERPIGVWTPQWVPLEGRSQAFRSLGIRDPRRGVAGMGQDLLRLRIRNSGSRWVCSRPLQETAGEQVLATSDGFKELPHGKSVPQPGCGESDRKSVGYGNRLD